MEKELPSQNQEEVNPLKKMDDDYNRNKEEQGVLFALSELRKTLRDYPGMSYLYKVDLLTAKNNKEREALSPEDPKFEELKKALGDNLRELYMIKETYYREMRIKQDDRRRVKRLTRR